MNILFDTSTRTTSIVLVRDSEVLASLSRERKICTCVDLPEAMNTLLASQGAEFKEIKAVRVGRGPGSFTGLRIGMSVARALSHSLKIPLFSFSSLEAIAYGVPKKFSSLGVVVDAKKKSFYFSSFSRAKPSGAWMRETRDMLLSEKELIAYLKPGMALTGDAVPLLRHRLSDGIFLSEDHWVPHPRALASLFFLRKNAFKKESYLKAVPNYLYAQDCQVTLKKS